MALCPFAKHRIIAPGGNDPRIRARVAILHVAVTTVASLFSFFRWRSGGIESHFYITLTGRIEQYRDTGWQADANYHANDFAISIETAGSGAGRWNRRQLRAIKRLLLWLHEAEGIPLQRCPQWDGAGVGYHVQFGAPGPWTPVAKSCPGRKRIDQFDQVLVPWMLTNPQEDDMPYSEDQLRKIIREESRAAVREELAVGKPPNDLMGRDDEPASMDNAVQRVWRLVKDLHDRLIDQAGSAEGK